MLLERQAGRQINGPILRFLHLLSLWDRLVVSLLVLFRLPTPTTPLSDVHPLPAGTGERGGGVGERGVGGGERGGDLQTAQ